MNTPEQPSRLNKITYLAMQMSLQINIDLEKYETCALLHQASLDLQADIELLDAGR
jgi:hypothetical protein